MTTRQPTELRRAQIADAALEVIAQQGLGRFTTAAIAAKVGITDGTLFRHFQSKEEIVLAALDRAEAVLFESFPPTHDDPVQRLEAFFRFRAGLVLRQPVIASLAFSDELPHAAGPAGAAQVAGWKQRTLAFIVDCVAQAGARGRLQPGLAPREVGLVVLGSVMALAKLGQAAGPDPVDRVWTTLSTFFLQETP